MSKLGETTDKILELLSKEENENLDELVKKVPLANKVVLDFLKEWGFIEIEDSTVRITDLGLAILTEE